MSTHDTPVSPVASLLERLENVRMKGVGRWVARCPAHDDDGPSLAVTERDDGTVLLHDFGGCSVAEVVAAAGLRLADLFPQTGATRRPEPRAFDAAQRLACIAHEATVAAIVIGRIVNGTADVSDDKVRERLLLASQRIAGAVW